MGSLMIFLTVAFSGILAFTAWGIFQLIKRHRMKSGKITVRFHSMSEDGQAVVDEKEINYGEIFNFSSKELKNSNEYVVEAIENGELKLGTTLEQQADLAKELIEEKDSNAK